MNDSDVPKTLAQPAEWILTYDNSLEWHTDIPLWDAATMLSGLFKGIGLLSDQVSAFVKANYERPVVVSWDGAVYYAGTVGKLAWIVLDELRDEQKK